MDRTNCPKRVLSFRVSTQFGSQNGEYGLDSKPRYLLVYKGRRVSQAPDPRLPASDNSVHHLELETLRASDRPRQGYMDSRPLPHAHSIHAADAFNLFIFESGGLPSLRIREVLRIPYSQPASKIVSDRRLGILSISADPISSLSY
jgi:hypothetical protein